MAALILWPLLLPLAAASGWYVARREKDHGKTPILNRVSREYYVGLNYLLNEQPDKAVDVFIKLLEVDGDTVETHLALGSLFRRRGEVDRASRIHQNLIARPQLSKEQREEALLALGRDYMSAGVLDRAERIFHELIELGGTQTTQGLRFLLDIYQQEKGWTEAIQIVEKIERATGEKMHRVIAHHYCELAETALKANNPDLARRHLRRASSADRNSVRASLLRADIELSQGHYKLAIKIYQHVKEQDPDFISEIIPKLALCYQKLEDNKGFIAYLKATLKQQPRISIILLLAEHLRETQGNDAAADFVAEQLRLYPSLRGLHRLIAWHIETTDGKIRDKLQMLQDLTTKLLEDRPKYLCQSCGFAGKVLHWYCPSCKQWNTIKPIHGLEGD